jgi:hypothetical protein
MLDSEQWVSQRALFQGQPEMLNTSYGYVAARLLSMKKLLIKR